MMLESFGTFTPPHCLTVDDRQQIADRFMSGTEKERWFLPYIFEKSQVEQRHCALLNSSSGDLLERQDFFQPVGTYADGLGPSTAARMEQYEQYAIGMAREACRNAFNTSLTGPEEITHLVTASCTGFAAPGFDLQLIDQLPLSRSVARTHLGFMGCHAGLNCLRVAQAYAAADRNARVLVCTTELCCLHYQYAGANDQKVANAIFSDGAGAAILSSRNDVADGWELAANGSFVIPDTADLMTWQVGDHGFKMGLSERIPATIEQHLGGWLDSWLAEQNLAPGDIGSWAVHPGGPQILNAFQKAMQVPKSDLAHSRDVLTSCGNMSSATIFFVLSSLRNAAAPRPIVGLGFGPGLTVEACLIR